MQGTEVITWEHQYLNLVREILETGEDRIDRTGTGTRAIFGKHLDINLKQGFPAVTTKKLAWKAVLSEILWFLEGTSDERRLAEILHGTRDPSKRTIWTDNAEASYWTPKSQYEGDLGRVYGVQWRSWRKSDGSSIDQIAELIQKLKTNPTDRRMIVSALNIAEFDQMALPPCHMMAQFFVANGELSCMMTQRSSDVALGTPFNIASYALLTHMIAHVTELGVGRLIINNGDTHLYVDHFEGVREQSSRTPLPPPKIWLNPDVKSIDGFTMNDVKLIGYESHSTINLKMSV